MCTKYFFKIKKHMRPVGITEPPQIVGTVDLRIVQGENIFHHNTIVHFVMPVDLEPWSKKLQLIKDKSKNFLKIHLAKNIDGLKIESETEEEFVWTSNNP